MKYKLLVAEDVAAERTTLCETLSRHLSDSVTIFEANDGNETLDLFYRILPDIAILNIEMPGLSGLDVARRIRESGISCILLFTSDSDDFSNAKQAIALRALDYILKPYEESKLILAVQDALKYAAHFNTILPNHPSAAPEF